MPRYALIETQNSGHVWWVGLAKTPIHAGRLAMRATDPGRERRFGECSLYAADAEFDVYEMPRGFDVTDGADTAQIELTKRVGDYVASIRSAD